jgi:pyrroloquinoline-quinone synthase
MVLGHADATMTDVIARAVEEAHAAWLAYRDGVARAMRLSK